MDIEEEEEDALRRFCVVRSVLLLVYLFHYQTEKKTRLSTIDGNECNDLALGGQ